MVLITATVLVLIVLVKMADVQDHIDLIERDEEFASIISKLEEADRGKLMQVLKTNLISTLESVKEESKPEASSNVMGTTASTSSEAVIAHAQLPKIGTFSGDEPIGKGEIPYDQWKHEVSSLKKENYNEHTVMQCIRRSLKGTASAVLLNLGLDVDTTSVVDKFNVVFGNILPSEMLLEDFYTARQKDCESVVAWGCRIESLLKKAKEQGTIEGTEDMSKTKFWSGLRNDKVKSALRHKFDTGESFHELLKRARMLEHEFQSKDVKVKSQIVDSPNLDKVLARLDKLEKQMSKLCNSSKTESKSGDSFCRYCKKNNHTIDECRILAKKKARQQENEEQSAPGAED